jgi:hypothetical protein
MSKEATIYIAKQSHKNPTDKNKGKPNRFISQRTKTRVRQPTVVLTRAK